MIKQPSPSQQPMLPWRRMLLQAVAVFLTLVIAGIAIALGLFIGRKTAADQWAILVTAAGWATYAAVALTDARHALLLWMVTAPFTRYVHLDIDLGRGIPNLTLNRFMAGTLFVLLLAQAVIGRRRLARFTKTDIFLALFCAAAMPSIFTAASGLKTAGQTFFDIIITPAIIYFLARNLITNHKELNGIIAVLVIAGLYLSILAIREQLTGEVLFYPEGRMIEYTRSIRRVVGLLGNPAFTAICISIAVPWGWYLTLFAPRHRLFYLLATGVMMAGVYFCMNRSGWGGLVTAIITLALFVKRFRVVFLLMLVVVVIVVSTYWALIISSAAIQERLSAQGPIEFRAEAWDVAIRMIRDNPILGVGYDNYQYLYRRYGRWDIYLRVLPLPHNTIFWVLLMGGVVAFIPFILFVFGVVFSALGVYFRARPGTEMAPYRDLAGVFLASISSVVVPALFTDIFPGFYNTMLLFLVMGAFFGAVTGEQRRIAAASAPATQPLPPVRRAPGTTDERRFP